METDFSKDDLFWEFYEKWIEIYKRGSVRQITLNKYLMTLNWIKRIAPDLKVKELNRIRYQKIINEYAKEHERQTTMDFHHQVKGAILDALDEGLLERDPTRKVVIKGKMPAEKKPKFLNQYELHAVLKKLNLEIQKGPTWEWLILLIAKTGLRFSEALAITPADFDFSRQTLSVSKTWDYKGDSGFMPTKNRSSIRKVELDWRTIAQFSELTRDLPRKEPIFVTPGKAIYNATINDVLERYCKAAGVPVITIHGLRHTHASILLYQGVSIASVARRLGHASIHTTQKTYIHIIQELENADVDLVIRSLSNL